MQVKINILIEVNQITIVNVLVLNMDKNNHILVCFESNLI